MEAHVFDVHGPFALFRKPYAPVSPVSFPFPPPPTVMGMVGAICGYGKDEYLERVGWDQVRVGVGIQNEVRRFRTGINLLNTKEGNFHDAVGESQRIQIPHEFLQDARFRLFVADGPAEMMEDLGDHLSNGTTTYTLSLGLSECLADLDYVGTFDAQPLNQGRHEVSTVVPDEEVERIHYDPERRYGHYRVPHRMAPGRDMKRYSVTVAEETGATLEAETANAYEVGEDRVVFL
jgi:CRISPR-associated protein Cas5h